MKQNSSKVTLCYKRGCCPTFESVDGGYNIRDDNGGIVTLDENEMKMLVDAYMKFKSTGKGLED